MPGAGFDCDVLVVGLGPVGATLAGLLTQGGIRTMALDKDVEVYPLPRAAHFDHEIMRLFQQLGIADAVLQHARPVPPYEFRTADGQVLMRFDFGQGSPSGWAAGYMFNQPGIEHALRAKLAESAFAEIRLGWRFEGLTQDETAVEAVIAGLHGRQTIRARYVIGCDGARSLVRDALGVTLADCRFDEPWLVIDAILRPGAKMPAVNLQICDPARPVTCVQMGPGRHRWEFMLLPGETAEQVLDDGFIRSLLAGWDCAAGVEIDRKAVYRFHGLVAETWLVGRVLLAGDSAHQMPPFAGQGMCSGLRDAANLAWKLKAVLKDGAGACLLDGYQPEREPHVRAYIELAIGMGRVVCLLDRTAAAARDAAMLAQRAAGKAGLPALSPPALPAGCILPGSPGAGTLFPQPWAMTDGGPLRLDDVLGDGAWLITRAMVDTATAPLLLTFATLADPALAPFRAAIEGWLDQRHAASVLVRPDRYVFGTGAPEALLEAFAVAIR